MTLSMEWDEIEWTAEVSKEENEIQLDLDGRCSMDERLLERFEENNVVVTGVKLEPEGETLVEEPATVSPTDSWHGGASLTPASRPP